MEKIRLKVENNALTNVPIWEGHKRGKNWFAVISLDPLSPGGLKRKFAKKAKGDYYYMMPDFLQVGDAVEFGADYYTGGGHRSANRWYGIVTDISIDYIELLPVKSSREACKKAEEYHQGKVLELTEEEQALIKQLLALSSDRLKVILTVLKQKENK